MTNNNILIVYLHNYIHTNILPKHYNILYIICIQLILVRIGVHKINQNIYDHVGLFACECITFITTFWHKNRNHELRPFVALDNLDFTWNRVDTYLHTVVTYISCRQIYKHHEFGSIKFVNVNPYAHMYVICYIRVYEHMVF